MPPVHLFNYLLVVTGIISPCTIQIADAALNTFRPGIWVGSWVRDLMNIRGETVGIHKVDRIVHNVRVKIGISSQEAYGVLGCPAPRLGVVVPRPKAGKPRVRVVEPSCEPEGLEAWVGIFQED